MGRKAALHVPRCDGEAFLAMEKQAAKGASFEGARTRNYQEGIPASVYVVGEGNPSLFETKRGAVPNRHRPPLAISILGVFYFMSASYEP